MNADGSEWIKNVCDEDTLFQLDPFHKNKAIKEKIHNKLAISAMMEYLAVHDIDGIFEYLERYCQKNDVIEELKEKAMSAATAPSKDGKGYEYAVRGHLTMLSNKLRGSKEAWLKMAGF